MEKRESRERRRRRSKRKREESREKRRRRRERRAERGEQGEEQEKRAGKGAGEGERITGRGRGERRTGRCRQTCPTSTDSFPPFPGTLLPLSQLACSLHQAPPPAPPSASHMHAESVRSIKVLLREGGDEEFECTQPSRTPVHVDRGGKYECRM
ncbi:Hypothetical predicted protein [Xyrichtys novacula]|uniref:Uncharacterized protein n=1 Tax=Xyrichtys novacula TaxID=13765 RepID=A0AAV1H4K0_XYRNO|nr:Hypothetical predicted protein [Xyrichtys novacula]